MTLLLLPLQTQAAAWWLSMSTGSGVVQLVETLEEPEMHISAPWVLAVDLRSSEGAVPLRVRLQYSSARVVGTTKVSGTHVDGWLDTASVFLFGEGAREWGRWHLSWGAGPGLGVEALMESAERGGRAQARVDVSARVGLAFAVNERMRVGLDVSALLSDVPRAVAYVLGAWPGQNGGEDVSAFVSMSFEVGL